MVVLTGCATYSVRVVELRPELAMGDFEAALETLDKTHGVKNMLLYYLEKGLILHYADRWQESNDFFQIAENLAADSYTKSISEGAISLFTSDNAIVYRADPFELAMVPFYRALNYIYLNEPEEALVEARKAGLYLKQFTDLNLASVGEEHQQRTAAELLYNNAFLQYFSAMLYESGGEVNNAFIAYRNAAGAYQIAAQALSVQMPPWMGKDLYRTGWRLGFGEELNRLRSLYPELLSAENDSMIHHSGPRGEVVLLLEFGYVASKVQNEINIPILERDDYDDYNDWAYQLSLRAEPGWQVPNGSKIKYWLRVALPEMVDEPPLVQQVRLSAGTATDHTVSVIVDNISARARLKFEAEAGGILLKTIARALAKYVAKEKADDLDETVGTLVNIFGAATETADTRSWLTLPHSIGMARLSLSPGTYDLRVDLVGRRGQPVSTETIVGVTVAEGDWQFLSRRVFD